MREIACQFGENLCLSGIMTCSGIAPSDQALIFLSVGFEVKHGPNRLYVQIARMAANHGIDSLRFDFGDLGYSQTGQSGKLLQVRKNDEIKAALDYVETTYKINRFILIGLCSGAEDAFRYANLDSRVQGITMVDTFSYETPRNSVMSFFSRLRRWFLREVRFLSPHSQQVENKLNQINLVSYNYMELSESKEILANLLRRKLKLHFIYTGYMGYLFNFKNQLWKMFPELTDYKDVALNYFPTVGHVQLLEEERQCLIRAIEKRLVSMYLQKN